MFTRDSFFSNEAPAFLAKHLQRCLMKLAIFTTEGLTEWSNSGPLIPKLDSPLGHGSIHLITTVILCFYINNLSTFLVFIVFILDNFLHAIILVFLHDTLSCYCILYWNTSDHFLNVNTSQRIKCYIFRHVDLCACYFK